jgi:hypothetical protein
MRSTRCVRRRLGEDFTGKAGTAAYVEDHGRGGEGEEGEGAVGHGRLDGADAGGGGVFAGFDVVVEEVWGAGGFVSMSILRC